MTPFSTMPSRVCSICSLYSMVTFCWGMLVGENTRVFPDGVGPGHVANGVE